MQALAKPLLVVLALLLLVGYFARRFPQTQKGTDFADFYVAARMVHDGRGRELYDRYAQDEYLTKYAGRVGTYFIHPPFETLVYLPFALFPLDVAYALWCAANAILLGATATLVSRRFLPQWDWRILLCGSLLFVPVLLNFMQGQDAVLLLFILTLALAAKEQEQDFFAGCILACGLFKFHLMLPAAIVIIAPASRKIAGGLIAVASSLILLSARISGWDWPIVYARFLRHLGSLPLAGIHGKEMANFRGLISTVISDSSPIALYLILAGSFLVFYFALPPGKKAVSSESGARLVFADAVLASVLIGYHLSPHDLSILLLPMALILHHLLSRNDIPHGSRIWLIVSLGVLALPVTHLWLLHLHLYAFNGAGVLVLFAATRVEIRRLSASKT